MLIIKGEFSEPSPPPNNELVIVAEDIFPVFSTLFGIQYKPVTVGEEAFEKPLKTSIVASDNNVREHGLFVSPRVNDNVLEYPDEMHGEPCGIEILLLPIRLTVKSAS